MSCRPCTPDGWGDVTVTYRHGSSPWVLRATGSGAVGHIIVDGTVFPGPWVQLADDGREHQAEFVRGAEAIA